MPFYHIGATSSKYYQQPLWNGTNKGYDKLYSSGSQWIKVCTSKNMDRFLYTLLCLQKQMFRPWKSWRKSDMWEMRIVWERCE
jgi:hypothetical protein